MLLFIASSQPVIRRSGVFIINFEQIFHFFIVSIIYFK